MAFAQLGLSQPVLEGIKAMGYVEPTPIQLRAIPVIMAGHDIIGSAQTGTGKTAAFALPILTKLGQGPQDRTRALILEPTRELAAQVETAIRDFARFTKLRVAVVFGGVGYGAQNEALKSGVDIIVATPGRLLDHMGEGRARLDSVEYLVLDEADRMLDMGFIHDIKRILALLPKQRQNLLFSATVSDEIKALADRLLDRPALIEVARSNAAADTVAQKVHPVDRDKKGALLAHLIKHERWSQVLIFTRTKRGANKLAEHLGKQRISALAIHGNKSQAARTKALGEFKAGRLCALVATDLAARGLDIAALPQVVNYELPSTASDYVHRIGRTGRAGASGRAVSLVCVDERGLLKDIERLIKCSLPREIVAGFEPDLNAKPQPIVQRSGGQGRRATPPRGRPNAWRSQSEPKHRSRTA
jgi:ATP-dependent RNA helicase RhlE